MGGSESMNEEVDDDIDEFSTRRKSEVREILNTLSLDVIVYKIFSSILFDVGKYMKSRKKKSRISVLDFFGYFKDDPQRKIYLIFSNFVIGEESRRSTQSNVDMRDYSFLPLKDIYGVTTKGAVDFYHKGQNILAKSEKLRILESNFVSKVSIANLGRLSKTLKKLVLKIRINPHPWQRDFIQVINGFARLRFLTIRYFGAGRSAFAYKSFEVPDLSLPHLQRFLIDYHARKDLSSEGYYGACSYPTKQKIGEHLKFKNVHDLRELTILNGVFGEGGNPNQAKNIAENCLFLRRLSLHSTTFKGLSIILGGVRSLRVVSLVNLSITPHDANSLVFQKDSGIRVIRLQTVHGINKNFLEMILSLEKLEELKFCGCEMSSFFFEVAKEMGNKEKGILGKSEISRIYLEGNSQDFHKGRRWDEIKSFKNVDTKKVIFW